MTNLRAWLVFMVARLMRVPITVMSTHWLGATPLCSDAATLRPTAEHARSPSTNQI